MNESISGGKMKHIKEIEGFVINTKITNYTALANYNGYYYETLAPRKDRLTNIRIDIE